MVEGKEHEIARETSQSCIVPVAERCEVVASKDLTAKCLQVNEASGVHDLYEQKNSSLHDVA